MVRVGIVQAKTQLTQLVECVARGVEVLVTRHGKPVARLVAPEASSDISALAEWTADLRAFRRGVDRGAKPESSSAELIAGGRR